MEDQIIELRRPEVKTANPVSIAIARGDGIGPEIMDAVLQILEASGAKLKPEFIEIGKSVYLSGNSSGISPEAWETIREAKILLKAPITTPQGKGFKSLNVTMRKALGLFANVRPAKSLFPYVKTNYPEMDVVVIRENEEDLYAGIEHQQTQDVVQCLKLITRPGCERIIRYAFEYARVNGRKKVTCMVKDNIMKLTDGLFHQVFKEIGAAYPQIEKEVQIIDIATARLATRPQDYDVIVTSNLYGDIISDVAAEITGSVGLAGSANIGTEVAMFEAIHGSAPDIAGKNIANPSGLLNAAVMMMAHLGQHDVENKITNAWLKTIEEGIHTADIFREGVSKYKVNTLDFTREIINRIDQKPIKFKPVSNSGNQESIKIPPFKREIKSKSLVGVDIFLDWRKGTPDQLGDILEKLSGFKLKLKMITNRGVKVYPGGIPETFCTDHWRCRFVSEDALISSGTPEYKPVNYMSIISLLNKLNLNGLDVIKTENLYEFNGNRGFSLGQGE